MRVASVRIRDFRSFVDSGEVELSRITVLVGPNNAGKSTVIKALCLMQEGFPVEPTDVRIGSQQAAISLTFSEVSPRSVPAVQRDRVRECAQAEITLNRPGPLNMVMSFGDRPDQRGPGTTFRFSSQEPGHFIVPYLARRKVAGYSSEINQSVAMSVGPTLLNLPAKLQRLANPDAPGAERYRETCRELLGYVVTAIPDERGVMAAAYVSETESIPISAMGEGVPNIVGLLAELALASGKLFVIEEPENDVHPKALKALLGLIAESSERNQFVVSTHSHIVVRHLASLAESNLYYINTDEGHSLPPESTIRAVEQSPAERIAVLSDLGYELYDFDLWDGWLILEESSAERIIRDILIPAFVPRLGRVRTLDVKGNSRVEAAFDDYRRLFLYAHLEEHYKNRAWVVIDGDPEGHEIIERLRATYPSWSAEHFQALSEPAFERYYPDPYREQGDAALLIPNKNDRREAKRRLVEEIMDWHSRDPTAAIDAFADSARPVIDILLRIDQQLFDA